MRKLRSVQFAQFASTTHTRRTAYTASALVCVLCLCSVLCVFKNMYIESHMLSFSFASNLELSSNAIFCEMIYLFRRLILFCNRLFVYSKLWRECPQVSKKTSCHIALLVLPNPHNRTIRDNANGGSSQEINKKDRLWIWHTVGSR